MEYNDEVVVAWEVRLSIYHSILIQSSYRIEKNSRRRLELSMLTVIPSLSSQTIKPVIHVEVSMLDPLYQRRIDAFRDTGCEVVVVHIEDPRSWNMPDKRKMMHRLDDDDVVSSDFCERTMEAVSGDGDIALIWPNGFVLYGGKLYQKQHHNNQFVALVTDRVWHPYQVNHHRFYNMPEWRNIIVSDDQAWVWVRHADSISQTGKVYRSAGHVDSLPNRFHVDHDEINRLVASMGRCR